jgi:hypothetical protein
MIRALLSDDAPLSINIDGRDVLVMSHALFMQRLADQAPPSAGENKSVGSTPSENN